MKCDRQQFIDGANGNLFTRNEKGIITQLGDAATHAIEAAERGKVVYLTVNGKVVSKIVDFTEIAVDARQSHKAGPSASSRSHRQNEPYRHRSLS